MSHRFTFDDERVTGARFFVDPRQWRRGGGELLRRALADRVSAGASRSKRSIEGGRHVNRSAMRLTPLFVLRVAAIRITAV
jgi:hypothetical protein